MSLGPAVRRITARVAGDAGALPDAELVRRFADVRDETAFAELVERYGPLVFGVCRRVLGHVQDAEDAAQAVFLVLARSAGRVRKQASVGCWLHGVAVRVGRKALARRARRPAPQPPTDAIPGPTADAADALTWADARRAIDDALAALPESLRLPVVLCYLQGLTRDEAAERLGWSLSTFRGRLERGRDRLHAELVRRGFPLSAGLVAVLLSESSASAAPGWSAAVTKAATGEVPVPEPILVLAHGVRFPMKRALVLWPAVLLSGVLVAALAWANTADPPKAAREVPKAPERLLKPDPKAPPRDTKFDGLWAARQDVPAGDVVRFHEMRFVDGEHLVWTFAQHSAGVRQTITTRFRYELKDGELRLHVLERFLGEEKLAPRPDDKNPRVYSFTWLKPEESPDRAGFVLKATGAGADSPWAVTKFFRSQEAEAPPDPLVPEYLTQIDRTIKKEPKYAGTPLYLLLAFGPEAKEKVWVVLDGSTLYVDRNGNGDLTDVGEAVTPAGFPLVEANPASPAFIVGELTVGGAKHTDFFFSAIRMNTGGVYTRFGLKLDGKTLQIAGPTSLAMAESPKDARVVHFGSPVVTVRPSLALPSTADANQPVDYRVQVGTPGVGAGSLAAYGSEHLPEGVAPVAEFEFTPLKPDDAPKKVTLNLTERCCGDHFFAKLAVPDGVKTGLDAAKVTLSFPNCPWGKVAPATYTIDVMPKQKK
jgi:RNA polymerase sigma factor (sigma-70 family)